MQLRGTIIEDTFAEAFRMWAARLIVTAIDERQVDIAVAEACGYGSSVIGCDAEAARECTLDATQTPDGRPGAAMMFFAFNAEKLAKAVLNRTGQCLMTCPTTAVYDGMIVLEKTDDTARLDLGKKLRFFGDGFQKSKVLALGDRNLGLPGKPRRFWRVPVMDGELIVEESFGAMKAIGGGNILIGAIDQRTALDAARRAVDAIKGMSPDGRYTGVIAPFPGGIVRSGSKVGSRYKGMFASTNDAFCPTLRGAVGDKSKLPMGVNCVYEIVINGLDKTCIARATRVSIEAACGEGIPLISAGNYGGNLGKFHFKLHDIMRDPSLDPSACARRSSP